MKRGEIKLLLLLTGAVLMGIMGDYEVKNDLDFIVGMGAMIAAACLIGGIVMEMQDWDKHE